MIKRPWVIWLVGLALILSPFYYYAERAMATQQAWTDPQAILARSSMFRVVAAVLGPIVGVLVLMVRRISWYAIIGYSAYVIAANIVLMRAHHARPTLVAVFVPLAVLIIVYFASREIRSPYFNPRLRWWVTDRERFKLRAEIDADPAIVAETLDISGTGVFLVTDHGMRPGSTFALKLFFEDAALTTHASVVWASDGKRRPRGIGAKFDDESARAVQAKLERVLKRVEERVPFTLLVDIAGKASLTCETFDISARGCFLMTDRVFAPGETLAMTLHMVDDSVAVEGTVVRYSDGSQGPRGVGVRFDSRSRKLELLLREIRRSAASASATTEPVPAEPR